MNLPFDAVIAGYVGLDITPGFPQCNTPVPFSKLFRPGKLLQTSGLNISLGGVVANTGLAMKKFGKCVKLMGLVGNDVFGDIVVTKVREQGVINGIRRTSKAGTSYGIVISPPGVDRMFLEDPGCNAVFTSDDIDYDAVAQSRLFHFGYPPLMQALFSNGGAELQKLFYRIKKLGVAASLDLSLPDPDSEAGKQDWQAILAHCLPMVDIFTPSIEEILWMLKPEEYADILAKTENGNFIDSVSQSLYDHLGDRILEMGVKILMIKAGHRGAYMRTGDLKSLDALKLSADDWNHRKLWVGAFRADPARVQNACGAGDCAVAGFLTAILEGTDIEKAGQYAMMAGKDNLYGVDALSGLSAWDDMTRSLDANKTDPPL